MYPQLKNKQILLASGSPRRRSLLGELDINVEIIKPREIDESFSSDDDPFSVAEKISIKKAEAFNDCLSENKIILTADTVVIVDGKVLGKPHGGFNAACEMLRMLSGKTHHVVTGVTLSSKNKRVSFSTTTEVKFKSLSNEEIEYYVEKYQPFDKAGAYGIQEWIGFIGIESINGCYYNVMGLPLHNVFEALKQF